MILLFFTQSFAHSIQRPCFCFKIKFSAVSRLPGNNCLFAFPKNY